MASGPTHCMICGQDKPLFWSGNDARGEYFAHCGICEPTLRATQDQDPNYALTNRIVWRILDRTDVAWRLCPCEACAELRKLAYANGKLAWAGPPIWPYQRRAGWVDMEAARRAKIAAAEHGSTPGSSLANADRKLAWDNPIASAPGAIAAALRNRLPPAERDEPRSELRARFEALEFDTEEKK